MVCLLIVEKCEIGKNGDVDRQSDREHHNRNSPLWKHPLDDGTKCSNVQLIITPLRNTITYLLIMSIGMATPVHLQVSRLESEPFGGDGGIDQATLADARSQ